jgi:alkanesulfonate monooxygenase SsuD/methylene tetrahydromethanopterin reductase-like flavin-dependent oxidoreductase (luciferase family)
MQFGIYTFGDRVPNPHTGVAATAVERAKEVLAAARLCDELGLDVFGVGEHHRRDTLISSPAVILSAIAAQTKKITLTSATTVLSTLDPVRVFEDFATLDVLSEGRTEIMVGRGAFTESYPLFGKPIESRDALFAEHLDLLIRLNEVRNEDSGVTWQGQFRPPLRDSQISPRRTRPMPLWIGVGVTPESARRAGVLGLPMNVAVLGMSSRLAHLAETYRRAGSRHPERLRVAISRHMHIQRDGKAARDEFHPHHARYFEAMGRSGMCRADFDAAVAVKDGLMVGSPAEVAEKILRDHELFKHERFLAQVDIGGLPYARVAAVIELFATEVVPIVKRALANAETSEPAVTPSASNRAPQDA